jgi:uncharacterized protein (TIGR03435 family)
MSSRQWLRSPIVVVIVTVTLSAQAPTQSFEVASIKKRDSPAQGFARLVAERGTFTVPSTTVAYLIQFAYDIRDDHIVDVPGWVRKDIFEVNAKAGRDASRDEMRPMMQSLLAERFGLVIRREQRLMPHFALVPARTDGSFGPTLRKTDDCRSQETRPKETPVPPGAGTIGGCGPLSSLATMVSLYVGAPVIDKTGTAGTFHYRAYLSPADLVANIPGLPPMGRPQIGPEADALPSLRDAMRDQLGLRMESVRGPLDVIAIVSVQQPTEN